MVGDAGENVAEVGFGVEAVELGGLDEGVGRGGASSAFIRSGEEIVFAAQGNAAQGALGGIVVDLQPAVVEVASQGRPACEGIAHGAGEFGLGRELGSGDVEPGPQLVDRRASSLPACLPSLVRRPAANLGFDAVQCADAVERLLGDRRCRGLMHVEELAPDVRPAGDLDHVAVEQGIEAGIAVGMQEALEGLQVRLRVLTLAVG